MRRDLKGALVAVGMSLYVGLVFVLVCLLGYVCTTVAVGVSR